MQDSPLRENVPRLPLTLLPAALLLAGSQPSAGAFTTGDIIISGYDLPTSTRTIYRLGSDDSLTVLVSGLSGGGVGNELAYDPFRDVLVFSQNDLLFMDSGGTTVDALPGSPYSVYDPIAGANGKLYYFSATGYWWYLDELNQPQTLLNAAGTGPYAGNGGHGPLVDETFDPATNSLIRFWPGASGGPCGAPTGSICIEKIPLTADGTQVAGAEETASVVVAPGDAVVVKGVSHVPGGDILFCVDTNATVFAPHLQLLDPETMTTTVYASYGSPGANVTAGCAYSNSRGLPVVVEEANSGQVLTVDGSGNQVLLGNGVGAGPSYLPAVQIGPVGDATSVGMSPQQAASLAVGLLAPNPFRLSTRLTFSIAERTPVRIAIFDVLGRKVRELSSEVALPAGSHTVSWDGRNSEGRDAVGGVYFARVEAAGHVTTRKVTLYR